MKRLVSAVAFAAALAIVPAAGSETAGDSVAGTAHFEAAGGISDSVEVGAQSGPLGENPRGFLVLRTINPITGEAQVFHGDVSEGCVRVTGSGAIVVGKLPPEEQFNVPPPAPQPFLIEFIGLIVADNGEPMNGQPVDLAQPIFFRGISAQNVCAGILTPLPPQPFESGNFVVIDG